MGSIGTPEAILAEFLNNIGMIEEKVEVTRQILVENEDFDAIVAFRRLDYNDDGKLTPQCVSLFLEENQIYLQAESINLLFDELDRDRDGFIDWDEFVKTVISKEASFYEKGTELQNSLHHPQALQAELEHSICRIFEEELAGLIKMEKYKLQLSIHPELGMVQSFKMIDRFDKGYFDIRDIQKFVSQNLQHITMQRAERILRRLDLDYDGRVIYAEWNQSTRPKSLN